MTIPFGEENRRIYFDGAMGTMLQGEGLAPGESPERWNILHPEAVRKVHEAYLAAGAGILKSNTFGANRLKMGKLGLDAREVIAKGVALAKEAVRAAGRGLVAMDIGPTGRLLAPVGDLAFEDAVSLFAEMVSAGRDAGADLILIETMSDLYEAKAAVLAAKENADLPVFVTMTFDKNGRLLTGGDAVTAVSVMEGLGVQAFGMNCGVGPDVIPPILKRMREVSSIPLIANPNAGLPRRENGRDTYDVGPEEFASAMREAAEAGASVLGGCCGTTPAHIEHLIKESRSMKLPTERKGLPAVITSGARSLVLDGTPILVGNRLCRPSADPGMWDPDDIVDEALAEADDGADVIAVSLDRLDPGEGDAVEDVIREIQSMTALPLALSAADPRKLEKAVREYNGKPLVGPIPAESAEKIFPIIRKYGGTAVCLTEAEDGVPKKAEERSRAADAILDKAEKYGISKNNLIIDPLEKTDACGGEEALAAVKMIRSSAGVKISFGASGKTRVTPGLIGQESGEHPDMVFADPAEAALIDAFKE